MAAAPARPLPGFLGAHENLNTRAQGARGSTREGRGRARDLASSHPGLEISENRPISADNEENLARSVKLSLSPRGFVGAPAPRRIS